MPLKESTKMSEFNKVYVYNLLKDKGYNENTIAGIMGNIDVETGGTFDFEQKQKGEGLGYGLFQFDPSGKRSYYDAWLEETGRDDSASSQIDFMHDSIYVGIPLLDGSQGDMVGAGNRANLRNTFKNGSLEEVTQLFQDTWEIPNKEKAHTDRRLASAQSFDPAELPHITTSAIAEKSGQFLEENMGNALNWVGDTATNAYDSISEGASKLYDSASNLFGGVEEPPAFDEISPTRFAGHIAYENGMTLDELQSLNPEVEITRGSMGRALQAGQKLKVGSGWYENLS